MDGIIVHLTTSTIWQCVLFLLRCIKSFPVYHWKRVLVLGPGFWVHLSERAVNCFGFLDVGGTFDRKDFLTVTLERCKIVLPLFTRVSFNRSTSNLTKALLYSNSCKSTWQTFSFHTNTLSSLLSSTVVREQNLEEFQGVSVRISR